LVTPEQKTAYIDRAYHELRAEGAARNLRREPSHTACNKRALGMIEAEGRCEAKPDVIREQRCPMGYTYDESGQIEIAVPDLMWHVDVERHQYSIFAVREDEEKKLMIRPYRLANVHPNGHVCWGRRNPTPKDLYRAIKTYWEAPFNKDLVTDFQYSLAHTLKNYDVHKLVEGGYEGWYEGKSTIFGNKWIARTKPAAGAVIGQDAKMLAALPDDYIRFLPIDVNNSERRPAAIGWLQPDFQNGKLTGWFINVDGFLLRRAKLTVTSKVTPLGRLEEIT
jgi:hypothetical protein